MSTPLISVIIVCRNPGPQLHAALESISTQNDAALEAIVIDGVSTDGSREWLETQRSRLAAFISEPDRGVYDAMNKGLALARGEWILFLGADDRLVGGAFKKIGPELAKTSAGVVGGEAAYDDGRIYPLRDPMSGIQRNFAHHQATFYRRGLFLENGDFQIGLRIAGDYEFNLRLVQRKIRFKSLRMRITACGRGGLSDSGIWPVYAEEILVRRLYFPAWRCWFWDAVSVARYLRKKIVRSFAKKRPE
ncbi:glycosyltransferase family 2 protein [Oleiharenicola lentus]|uniref:glycosyltransferase family 2 protein n=1 Tax=Oleiharenicola lentus TaxID=2508720 RepID=UPI003F67E4C8